MSWWTSMVSGAQAIGYGTQWALNTRFVKNTLAYTTNTAFYVVEQGLALREAVPGLLAPSSWNIIQGMGHVVFYDVLPIVTVNYINNSIQEYFREGQEEEQASEFAAYTAFLSLLTVINYGVQAYTLRQGTQLVLHTVLLDSMGASAFNAYKADLPPMISLCKEKKGCNFKRRFKGSLREPFILASNDALIWIFNQLPYIGDKTAWVLSVYFYGEYITRMATPERCERHKAMKSDSVLSLGLTYTFTSKLMQQFLESTVGSPPFLCYRTLRHFLLLLHLNLAAHMILPIEKDETSINPLVIYERISRFIVDVAFAGLIKRIPIDFKPPPNAKPFMPLSSVLKFLTKILESDLERTSSSEPGWFKKMVVPKTFHSTQNMVNDPIIRLYWPGLQESVLSFIDYVKDDLWFVPVLTTAPKPVASTVKYSVPIALNLFFGLPVKLSEFLLSLSKKEDFWKFITVLKLWIERHNLPYDVHLTKADNVGALHGESKIIEPRQEPSSKAPLPSADDLLPPISASILPTAQELTSSRTSPTSPISVTANSLFTPRRRAPNPIGENTLESAMNSQLLLQ